MRISIEKLVFGGQGLGRADGKVIFAWNALPDEIADVAMLKSKKSHGEAVATNILSRSPDRIEPRDDHFLSCAPWQILSAEAEVRWKIALARETYEKIGGFAAPGQLEMVSPAEHYGYRNKMEYSFQLTDTGSVSFAFFDRGGKLRRPIAVCALADARLNAAAERILAWINAKRIPIRSLKSAIIRSNSAGDIIAGLFIKDRLAFDDYPPLGGGLVGMHIYYSTHKSPASVPTAILASFGAHHLVETIMGKRLSYGLFSFFQIHIPMFERALADIATHLPADAPLLDFYSGVGSIGIPLADRVPRGTLLESNPEAVEYAAQNIRDNALSGYDAICAPAEKMTQLITGAETLIVDPPRAGLHADVIGQILSARPPRVIYLSCNLATQARDVAILLGGGYELSHLALYNFFPRTPHIEGLAVLKKTSQN
jgi:23S rRNA (uracil1939-C5)-methyltransferase